MRKIRLQPTEQQGETVPASVVVIDDSPTVCKIIEVTFSRAGYQVNTFVDGARALSWLTSKEANLPHLLFIDIQMPKLSGYQVVQHIKTHSAFARAPIIMMSRRDGVVDRLLARLCGAQVYLKKPFTTQQLLSLAQQYLHL